MKFAIIFVLASCLVGLSFQQRFIWSLPYAPRPHLTPLFYADGQPAGNIDPSGEINLGGGQQQNKFLAGLLSPSSSIYLYTTTTTVVSTVVSTLTTPTSVKCIPSAQFSATANVTSCSRRRREIESPIEPNQPLALEPSAIANLPTTPEVKETNLFHSQTNIESSQQVDNIVPFIMQQQQPLIRAGLPNIISTVTVVSSAVSYTYVPATIKVSETVGATSGLLCLPAGYVIC